MKLTDSFNSDYTATRAGDGALQMRMSTGGGTNYMLYDFNLRLMTVRTGSSDGGAVIIPFSQLDPDSLVALREKLIELGGKPPELPSVPQARNPGATFKP